MRCWWHRSFLDQSLSSTDHNDEGEGEGEGEGDDESERESG